jgi:D-lactate dehydrogenase (cytochrome)
MASNIAGLKAVLADGRITDISERSPLMHLFIGSEGTLGVITELTLRLAPSTKQIKTVFLCYSRLEEAALVIPEILRTQEGMIACFLLDCGSVRVLQDVHRMAECPTILLQMDYDKALNKGELVNVVNIEEWSDEAMQKMLWASLARAWLSGVSTTVTVPPSRMAELVRVSSGRDGAVQRMSTSQWGYWLRYSNKTRRSSPESKGGTVPGRQEIERKCRRIRVGHEEKLA